MKRVMLSFLAWAVVLPGTIQPVAANQEQQWDFKVYLDDRSIGYHRFRLIPQGDGEYRLNSRAHFDVKFLFFIAYRYRHSDTELWQGRCLQSIEAQTNDNGRKYSVRGIRNGKGFELVNRDEQVTEDGCVQTFAYWDPSILKARRLLNSQTGEFVDVRVEPLGEETISVRGQAVQADRYRLYSELGEIDLWYAADNYRWLALQSTTESGRKLSYRMN